jgi:hypothetical protein
MTMSGKMLILRGISGTFCGQKYSNGALDEPSALQYARRRGYDGYVLDASGETGDNSIQTRRALTEFRKDKTITALYGFSGGGYNIWHILKQLKADEKERLELVVVLGAPKTPEHQYKGTWELVYRIDPQGSGPDTDGCRHMSGPRVLLGQT